MFLQYYVTESTTGNLVNIEINAATKADLDATRNGWQTVWNTDFILDPQKEKYAAKTEDGEIIALGAYRVWKGSVAVYIAYIESQPESNPTLVEHKKYSGIGKAMIAFGIQLSIDASCNGVVVFEAKTDDLEQHYIRDFGGWTNCFQPANASVWIITTLPKKTVSLWKLLLERTMV